MIVCEESERAGAPTAWEGSVLLQLDKGLSNGLTDAQLLQLQENGFPEFDLSPSHSPCGPPHWHAGRCSSHSFLAQSSDA